MVCSVVVVVVVMLVKEREIGNILVSELDSGRVAVSSLIIIQLTKLT